MKQVHFPGWLVGLDQSSKRETVGSKAFNLSQLHHMGFRVPRALVIPTFDKSRLPVDKLSDFMSEIEKMSQTLSDLIPSKKGWAVRSSATVEDLKGTSMAGCFDTCFIESPSQLIDAVKQVWDSAGAANIGVESMGVIVQKLIDADFAGVAFSRDPVKGDNKTVIEMCRGRAANLVDGQITPFRVSFADKHHELPEDFSEKMLKKINKGVKKLAKKLEYAVDVEWAVKKNKLYWLQVRPMTDTGVQVFTIPKKQRISLSGLWVRMQHSFSPQMPLVASLNPGGYFNFAGNGGWDSQLVNQFHYIKMKAENPISLLEHEYEKVLDHWDITEEKFTKQLDQCLKKQLKHLSSDELWRELHNSIDIKKSVYEAYMDKRFLYIRDKMQNALIEIIKKYPDHEKSGESVLTVLLGGLGSLTDKKQKMLIDLAKLSDDVADITKTDNWQQFVEEFGYESASTQLFYLPTLKETPQLILQMINRYKNNINQVDHYVEWKKYKIDIEKILDDSDKQVFQESLLLLRRCMKRTEDDDYLLQKATANVRYILLAIGRFFKTMSILASEDEVFFMKADELENILLKDICDIKKLNRLIKKRKKKFNKNNRLSSPPLIINGKPMYPKAKSDKGVLHGTPASPGVAMGRVIVLDDPFSCATLSLPKDSVVVSPIITPALAYTLLGCAAVVTEVGGMASHGAIVAREMGVPAVVGIKGVRELLKMGTVVTVDGSSGKVFIQAAYN